MPLAPLPESPQPPPGTPHFTIASWVILLVGPLLTFLACSRAYAHRAPGEWLPGFTEMLMGWAATALGSLGYGLLALARRERYRAWALLPVLAGLGSLILAAYNFFSKR